MFICIVVKFEDFYHLNETHLKTLRWIFALVFQKADFAVGPLSVMAERENVIDFTVPYYDLVGMTILMKRPEVTYSLFRFLTVLDEAVWGCITGAFFLFSLLLCFFDRFSPFSYQNNRHVWNGEGHEPRVFSLKEGIWFCMMSLTPQGNRVNESGYMSNDTQPPRIMKFNQLNRYTWGTA